MAGAGYKLFATGDVLTASDVNTYLMQQTVMVFANAAARTTALSGVVAEGMLSYLKDTNAVEVYDGANWVASDDPNAIQNTIVDAKGDLITATGADTPARLAVGSNGDTLVADSAATTGLRWQASSSAGKNIIINGGMDVWQRGTSFTQTTAGRKYAADRWQISTSATCNTTFTRQTTSDTTNLPTIQYALRAARDNGQTGLPVISVVSMVETTNAITYAGQTVAFSFYARRGANFSGASNQVVARLVTGTGTDQNLADGYTGEVALIAQNTTLTTTWQRFTYSATIAAGATEFAVQVYYQTVGTAGAADYFEVTGVQVELGSVATTFSRAAGTIQGELAACQRYYQKSYSTETTPPTNTTLPGIVFAASGNVATSGGIAMVTLKSEMRVAPTVTVYSYTTSQTGRVSDNSGTDLTASSGFAQYIGTRSFEVANNSGGTLTSSFNGFIFHYVASAEL
jgi:hypothetical protein